MLLTMDAFRALRNTNAYRNGNREMSVTSLLAERYIDERPFAGVRVACGHVLVFNSLEALWALALGGAELVLCNPFPSVGTQRVAALLAAHGLPVVSVDDAAKAADIFLDVTAVLGRRRLPQRAAEISRSGDHFYAGQSCITVSADLSNSKRIECFFGLGNGLVRGWRAMRPDVKLAGRRVALFGFGKVGRGLAHILRLEGVDVTVVETQATTRALANQEGFETVDSERSEQIEIVIAKADAIVAATGVPDAVANTVPTPWLERATLELIPMSAVDEFGTQIAGDRVLGGTGKPLNFHLESPTHNRYIDPTLAAHVLALEQVVRSGSDLSPGLHMLDARFDDWVLSQWQAFWPDYDVEMALV